MKIIWMASAWWICALIPLFGQQSSSSPDTKYILTQGMDGKRPCLKIAGPDIPGNPIIWTSPYGFDVGRGAMRERIAKIIWAPARSPASDDTLFAFATNRVRVQDVLQPDSLYVYSCESELVFFKRFGLRWGQKIEWSPDSTYIATIASTVGEKTKALEKVVIFDVYSGETVATLYDNAIHPGSEGIAAIQFTSSSSMDVSYMVNGLEEQYEWKFKH